MNKDLYKTFLYNLENIKISFEDLAENNIKYFFLIIILIKLLNQVLYQMM